MASAFATIGVSIRALTGRFRAGMARATKSLNKFGAAALTVRTGMGGFAAALGGGPVIAAGVFAFGLFKAGQAVEMLTRAMNQSLAIMGEVSKTMREDMTRAAIEMARVSVFSSQEVAKSFFFLASAGLDAARAFKALPVVVAFAQAGMFNVARATELLTDAQTALGLKVKNATKNMRNMILVGDAIVKANTLADQTTEQFAIALSRGGGMARVFGVSLEDTLAVLAAFADQNLKAEEGGTAFNIVVRDLLRTSGQFPAAFRRMGITVTDTAGRMVSMVDIVKDLERVLSGMSARQIKATLEMLGFQERAVKFTAKLIGMSTKMEEVRDKIRKAGGMMAEVTDKQLTDFQKGWENLSGATLSYFRILEAGGPALGEFLNMLAGAIDLLKTLTFVVSQAYGSLLALIGAFTALAAFDLSFFERIQIALDFDELPVRKGPETLGDKLKALAKEERDAAKNLVRAVKEGERAAVKLKTISFGLGRELAEAKLGKMVTDGEKAATALEKMAGSSLTAKKALEELGESGLGETLFRDIEEARTAMEAIGESLSTNLRTLGLDQFEIMADTITQAAKLGGKELNEQARELFGIVNMLQDATREKRGLDTLQGIVDDIGKSFDLLTGDKFDRMRDALATAVEEAGLAAPLGAEGLMRQQIADLEEFEKQLNVEESAKRRIGEIALAVRTPFQIFDDTVRELGELLKQGLPITVAERQIEKAKEALTTALRKGEKGETAEGRFVSGTAASLGLLARGGPGPLISTAGKIESDQLDQQKLTVAELQKMNRFLQENGLVAVAG